MKIQRKKLKNGIQLIHYYLPATQSVTFTILCNVGSSSESIKENGMAHFLEHMVFEGSKKYPNIQKTHFDLEKYGIIENAWTLKNVTSYWMKMPVSNIKKGLTILVDRVFFPLFPKLSIKKQIQIVLEEIKMGKDNPEKVVWLNLQKHLFRESKLSHPVIGYEKTVGNFTRRMVQTFHSKHYHVDNTIFWIGGNISFRKTVRLLENLTLPRNKKKTMRKPRVQKKQSRFSYFVKKDINAYHTYLGVSGFGITRDNLEYLLLAQYIIGVGRGSKLYQALKVQQPLASEIDTELISFVEDGLLLCVVVSEEKRISKAIGATLNQIKSIYNGNILDNEFERGKNLLLADFLSMQESSEQFGYTESLLNLIRREMLSKKKMDYDKVLDQIRNATKKDVIHAFRHAVKKSNLVSSVVGPDTKTNTKIKSIMKNFSWN